MKYHLYKIDCGIISDAFFDIKKILINYKLEIVSINYRFYFKSIVEKDLSKKPIKNYSNNVTILLVWHQKCNKKFLDKFPNLKAIIRYSVVDDIDLELAKNRSIKVANLELWSKLK